MARAWVPQSPFSITPNSNTILVWIGWALSFISHTHTHSLFFFSETPASVQKQELIRLLKSVLFPNLRLSHLTIMYPGGYTAEVTSLSPKATENDVHNFFMYCGIIEHVEIIRSGEDASAAYVTFRDAYALETALLLNGSVILDQCICISRAYVDDYDNWNSHASKPEDSISTSEDIHMDKLVSSPGEAITLAQEVVQTMVAKGYVLGKDAFIMAKAFDESLSVSSTAASKVAELSNKIGLTDTINSGIQTFKSVDEKYHVTDITKSAATVTGTTAIVLATVTGKAAVATGNAIVNSRYFAKGSLWVSDMLTRAAKAAADLGQHEKK